MGELLQSAGGVHPGHQVGYRLEVDFRQLPPEFEGCFTSFYNLTVDVDEAGATLADYLQPEWANVRFFSNGGPLAEIASTEVRGPCFVATGPSALPCRFEIGQTRMWGLGFLPLGWARFFGANASDCANMVCDGATHPTFAHFAELTAPLCSAELSVEEQIDTIIAFLSRKMRPTRDDARIRRMHVELVSGEHASVHDLADACAMSIRTLERMSMRYFGFTPKLLMRRQRFMRSLTTFMLHRGSRWTEAMDDHYHDQAQFTREFHEFMTMNPSEYAALDHPILTSFMEARARIWGSAAQTLDSPR